jgi:hypothetical protein
VAESCFGRLPDFFQDSSLKPAIRELLVDRAGVTSVAMSDTTKIPLALLDSLARRYGLTLIPAREIETQLEITTAMLDAAFVMYDAIEQITKLDNRAAPNAAALIARRAKKDVDSRIIGAEGGS